MRQPTPTTNFKVKKRYHSSLRANVETMPTICSVLSSLFLLLVVIPFSKDYLYLSKHLHLSAGQNLMIYSSSHFAAALKSPAIRAVDPEAAPQLTTQTSSAFNQASNQTAIQPIDPPSNLVKQAISANFQPASSSSASRLLAAILSRPAQQREHQHQKTTYACEGNILELTCPDSRIIHVLRANFGRFSVSICNDLGHSNLSVTCHGFRAFLTMQDSCNKLNKCSVLASVENFGDSCEGTAKYLEVQYSCNDANPAFQSTAQQVIGPASSLNRASPSSSSTFLPNQLQQQPQQVGTPALFDQQQGDLATPTQSQGGHKSPQAVLQQQQQQQQQHDHQLVGGHAMAPQGGSGMQGDDSLKQGLTVIQQDQIAQPRAYCPPQTGARNMFWNFTRVGQLSYQPCPDGFSGRARWFCDQERMRFLPAWSPDFSQCHSNWLQKLSSDLGQILEAQNKNVDSQLYHTLAERLVKEFLRDLDLLTESQTKLFSKDLMRIDSMINQVLRQFKFYALTVKNNNSDRYQVRGSSSVANLLYEELFSNLLKIVSNLFDMSQRQAWVEVQPNELRQTLEIRFLTYLREAGQLLASTVAGNPEFLDQFQRRQANIFAAFTLPLNSRFNLGRLDPETQELNIKVNHHSSPSAEQLNLNKFILLPDDQINEFRIHLSALKEMAAVGVTRFLVMDVKKPDYSLIRQQLETAYSGLGENSLIEQQQTSNNLASEPQWSLRIFGVSPIVSEENPLDLVNMRLGMKLNSILSQWPISVEFEISPVLAQQAVTVTANPKLPLRQCHSITEMSPFLEKGSRLANRCHTLRSNATNHVCRCEQLGFISLASSSSSQNALLQWSSTGTTTNLSLPALGWSDVHDQSPPAYDPFNDNSLATEGSSNLLHRSILTGTNNNIHDSSSSNSAFLSPQFSSNSKSLQQQQQQPVGLWASIFIVLGLTLLVVTLAAFTFNAILRISSQRRLNKKQGFLAVPASFLGSSASSTHHQASRGASTTGPLASDHHSNLMVGDAAHQHANLTSSATTTTTHSGSMATALPLSAATHQAYQAANSAALNGYKPHQQLYAAHYPQLELRARAGLSGDSSWSAWLSGWLQPSRWFSRNKGASHLSGIQHRILGSSLASTPNSLAFKSQIQNGYSTGLHHQMPVQSSAATLNQQHHHHHHHHHQQQQQHMPLAAPSSSTSSYVSSSAFYEEIGPGNLTKVSTSQLMGSQRAHTLVDPFKRQQQASAAPDQQQLLSSPASQQQLHHHFQLQSNQQQMWMQNNSQQQALEQHQGSGNSANNNYTAPSLGQTTTVQKQLHSDLSQLQTHATAAHSSSSSTSTASTANPSLANPTTPRHYLFASPSAVSAYKSSISQHNLQHHLQQQQQHYQQHRFLPN